MSEVRDLRTNFSDIELDLTNEYCDKHKGDITQKGSFIMMESEYVNSSFIIKSKNNERSINVCHYILDDFNTYTCFYPSGLKTNLGL